MGNLKIKINFLQQAFKYKLTIRERVLAILESIVVVVVLGYFFYRSVIWTIMISPIFIFYLNYRVGEICEKKRWELMIQFKELILSVNSSIQAGSSMETAFNNADRDMLELYDANAQIIKELAIIKNGLKNNYSLVNLLKRFAMDAQIDEINSFANVLIFSKQSGGNVKAMMESYIHVIDEKVLLAQEIETTLSAKKYEQKIMNIVPFVLIFYVDLTSPGFFNILYHNLFGNMIMTFMLATYIFAYSLSVKIVNRTM